MDSSVDPAIREAELRAKIKALEGVVMDLKCEIAALKGVAGIEAAEMKKMKRLLAEALHGAAARGDGPGKTDRAIDKG